MRHHKKNRTLNRDRRQRKALYRALMVSIIMKGRFETSEVKAKEIRPRIEKLVSTAKKGTIPAYRDIISLVGKEAGKKLFTELAANYKSRMGGYTRIIKLVARKGDGSARAIIEFV